MTAARRHTTALAVSVASLFALTGGIANASANYLTYRGEYSVRFSTEASCAAESAARNDPPDVLTYTCSYYASDPRGPSGNGGAGWFYYYRYEID